MIWQEIKAIVSNACFINEPEFRNCIECNKFLRSIVSRVISFEIEMWV